MKKGFTLAEVLITLTVLGVVTALSVPLVHQSAQKSQVAPSIRKFISTLETANEHILVDNEIEKISDTYTVSNYTSALTRYIQGTAASKGVTIGTYRGSSFMDNVSQDVFTMADDKEFFVIAPSEEEQNPSVSGAYKGVFAMVYFDINGFQTKPNRFGKDIFVFQLDNSGAVFPYGSQTAENAYGLNASTNCISDSDGKTCAGFIANSNWKIEYKY